MATAVGGGSVTVRCPAKINLFLEVLGKRPDGYHEIETVMISLTDLCDVLTVEPMAAAGIDLRVDAPSAWAIPKGQENLVHRAAKLYLEEVGLRSGVRIHLEKRIPPGAGLGGGSSDAAKTLLAMQALFQVLPAPRKIELAARLGSDVPFFLLHSGAGRAVLAEGRGERMHVLSTFGNFRFLVFYPGVPASTSEVYARCRPAKDGERRDPGPVRAALMGADPGELARSCFNRLAAPALGVCPVAGKAVRLLESLGLGPVHVTGSGSACFLVLPEGDPAEPLLPDLAEGWPEGAMARVASLVRS